MSMPTNTDDSTFDPPLHPKHASGLPYFAIGVLGGVALFVAVMAWYFLMVDQPPPASMPLP